MTIATSIQRQLNANYYISLVSFVILYYDYLLSVGIEYERFWKAPKATWASCLFFLNRYLSLFGHIPVIMEYLGAFKSANASTMYECLHLKLYHQYFSMIVQIVVAALLIMRVYSLYYRWRGVLYMYLGLSIAVIGCAAWALLTEKHDYTTAITVPMGCSQTLSSNDGTRLAIAWSGVLVFDLLVFSMTLYKSITLRRSGNCTLINVLLRDGAVYFGVMVASTLVNILTFILGSPNMRGCATTFTNILSSTIISRLMLNLRNPDLSTNTVGSKRSALTTIVTDDNWEWISHAQDHENENPKECNVISDIEEIAANIDCVPPL